MPPILVDRFDGGEAVAVESIEGSGHLFGVHRQAIGRFDCSIERPVQGGDGVMGWTVVLDGSLSCTPTLVERLAPSFSARTIRVAPSVWRSTVRVKAPSLSVVVLASSGAQGPRGRTQGSGATDSLSTDSNILFATPVGGHTVYFSLL